MKRLVAGVRGLKGKFLLTVWESKENRNLFKEFNLRSVDVPKMGGDLSVGAGKATRKELYVSNYGFKARESIRGYQDHEELPILVQEAYKGGKGPKFKILKKNKRPLTTSERETVMRQKAVWHHGPNGEPSSAVWKAVVEGVTWYVTNTHRAYNLTNSLQGTIKRYHDFIKSTAR